MQGDQHERLEELLTPLTGGGSTRALPDVYVEETPTLGNKVVTAVLSVLAIAMPCQPLAIVTLIRYITSLSMINSLPLGLSVIRFAFCCCAR